MAICRWFYACRNCESSFLQKFLAKHMRSNWPPYVMVIGRCNGDNHHFFLAYFVVINLCFFLLPSEHLWPAVLHHRCILWRERVHRHAAEVWSVRCVWSPTEQGITRRSVNLFLPLFSTRPFFLLCHFLTSLSSKRGVGSELVCSLLRNAYNSFNVLSNV